VGEPEVVDHGHAVSRAEDEVDEALAGIGLGQPVRERALRGEPGLPEGGERRLALVSAYEDVQILRVADDTGVLGERLGPPIRKSTSARPRTSRALT
jgi:hypothetical protein